MSNVTKSTEHTRVTDRDSARVRMTLDLSNRLNTTVEQMAEAEGLSKADVLRFAVEFLSAAKKAKEAGMHVGAWFDEAEGKRVEREFIGL